MEEMPEQMPDQAILPGRPSGMGAEPTFSGVLSFMRRRYSKDLTGVDIAVAGVPFDTATTNRPGTRLGPRAIRSASSIMSWGTPWPWGFDPFERLNVVDFGDCGWDLGKPETAPGAIQDHAKSIIDAGVSLVTLGGDHFISLPLLRAHAEKHGPVALLHFDAHPDTWDCEDGRVDHGTMFWHAVQEKLIDPSVSVQVGIRTQVDDPLGIQILDAMWIAENGPRATAEAIKARVGDRPVYLTFDIDCLDPAFAPGTGTPVSGGLSTLEAQTIFRNLQGVNFIGMDMVEVAPAYDHAQVTALAAASLVLDYLCLLASTKD